MEGMKSWHSPPSADCVLSGRYHGLVLAGPVKPQKWLGRIPMICGESSWRRIGAGEAILGKLTRAFWSEPGMV